MSHLFIFSIIYISMESWFLFYTLDYNSINFIHFVSQIVPARPLGTLSVGFYIPLAYPLQQRVFVILNITLLSGTITYCRLILCISCPSPHISHFHKDFCFLLLQNVLRNQDLGSSMFLLQCCYSQPTEQGNTHVHWHLYIYIYWYFYM